MKKAYNSSHPLLEQEQLDLSTSVMKLLNCRRFIQWKGFQEVIGDSEGITGIAGGSARIILSDGSTVSNSDFQDISNRDLLLERMVSKEVILSPNSSNNTYTSYGEQQVITSLFKHDRYSVHLAIQDTTRQKQKLENEKLPFWKQVFIRYFTNYSCAEMFNVVYCLRLIKEIITDEDIEEFAGYQQGLDDAIKRETLWTYSPQVKPAKTQEVEMPQEETHFINPWEVQIPNLRGKKG